MPYPIHRKRRPPRLRIDAFVTGSRDPFWSPSQFILPLFACLAGRGSGKPIGSMPGNYQLSIDELVKECEGILALGIGGVMLFGIPDHKDEVASEAYAEDGIVQRAVRGLKSALPKLLVVTDVCNCEYTSHGHCGKIVDGDVDNDTTLQWLSDAALSTPRWAARTSSRRRT